MNEKHWNTNALYAWIPSDVNSLRHKDFMQVPSESFSMAFFCQMSPLLMAN
jgi:hypothetical protein